MKIRYAILFIPVFFYTLSSKAQDKSNRGKEFWLAYGFNYHFLPNDDLVINDQELALYISTVQAATVTVSVSNTGYTQTLNIPANTVDATVLIPKTGPDDARTLADGLQNRGIHIISDVPVAVYAHEYAPLNSGATMLMPVETNGFLYHSINYYQTTSQTSPANWYSWFYAIASEDNTRLEITPSDTTKNGWLPGQTYIVNLNKGESYHVFGKAVFNNNAAYASKDMTGSKIVSILGGDGNCHPVAVFSGSGGIRICQYDGGEIMRQQVFPAQAWGTRYLTYHTINNTNTDILETNRNIYRVCVADPTTVVKKNGVVMTGLIKNFFYEYMDSTGGDYIEADKPILVAQYMVNENQCWRAPPPPSPSNPPSYGDPEMFYLSPLEQGQNAVLFYASRKSTVTYVYTNIILPTAGVSSLKVDGASLPANQVIPHPKLPAYSVALARFTGPGAQHTITSDSTFNATVYGLGNFESYGYNVGTLINNLNFYSAIKNSNNTNAQTDTFTCPKTPVRLFVKIASPATSIHWKLSQAAGITPNTDSIINNPVPVNTEQINGRTYYVYTLQQDFTFANPGTFIIPVSYAAAVIQNCSQTENASVKVVVKPGPVADFTIPSACPNQPVLLTGTSNAAGFTLASYLWNFPDATTQTTVNATKTFPAVGSYNVRYRIYADNGCAGDTTRVVSIGSPVSLSVTATGKACVDSVFTFTSSVPTSTSNPPTWYWNFGDGQSTIITNSNTVTHTYASTPPDRVKHVVSFTTGCETDTALYSIPAIKTNPAAFFSFITDTLCERIPVRFTSSLTGISTWSWNFGNGTGSAAPPFYHSYNTANTYNTSLVVTDVNGCGSLPFVNPITIRSAPPINAGPDKFIPPNAATTLDAAIPNPGNYDFLWTPATFLNLATVLNPVANPDRKITYTIRATDKLTNCVASDSMVVTPITVIFVPTAFTPDNNGINDVFKILGTDAVSQFQVKIFNRYGQTVFETTDKTKGWDGTFSGKPASPGGYVYLVKYKAINFPDIQMVQGSFILIR